MNISVIGLGKLGSPLAAWLATEYNVVCYDVDPAKRNALSAGLPPVEEPGLARMITQNEERLHVRDSAVGLLDETQATFIVVPTPSRKNGRFDSKYVEAVAQQLGVELRKENDWHLFVVVSTLMPFQMLAVQSVLESVSGKKAGVDFGLCYNPEFIALGDVLHGLQHPDYVLIGEGDVLSGDVLEDLYHTMKVDAPIHRMNFANAELAKLVTNAYVTMKISFANMIGYLCTTTQNADVNTILNAVGSDKRIGHKYLRAGPAFGGPCLPSGTLVQTSKGLKEIQDIVEGDLVIAHDGRYHRVTETHFRRYEGDLIKVVPEGFPKAPLVCTPEHPVWGAKREFFGPTRFKTVSTTGKVRLSAMTGHSGVQFVPAGEIEVGDLLALPRLDFSPMAYEPFARLRRKSNNGFEWKYKDIAVTPDLMRVVGWYISEGSTWTKEIKFSLHKDEEHYANGIGAIIQAHLGVKTKIKGRSGNGIYTRTTCAPLARWLRDTFGAGSHNKRVPHYFISLPDEHLIQLLRGIWYGDGSNSDSIYTYGTVSKQLFNFLKLSMLRLGIAFSTKRYKERVDKNGVHHRPAYHLRVCNPPYIREMNKVLPDLAIPTERKGKQSIWFEDNKMLYHIRTVGRIPYSGMVYNLEVEGAESYMLESSVVHNCFPRDSRALQSLAEHLVLPAATDDINDLVANWLVCKVVSHSAMYDTIAVLGLSYKPGTPVTEESASMRLLEALPLDRMVLTYDPEAPSSHPLEECLNEARVVVIMHHTFCNLEFGESVKVVIDPWRVMAAVPEGVRLVQFGRFHG